MQEEGDLYHSGPMNGSIGQDDGVRLEDLDPPRFVKHHMEEPHVSLVSEVRRSPVEANDWSDLTSP